MTHGMVMAVSLFRALAQGVGVAVRSDPPTAAGPTPAAVMPESRTHRVAGVAPRDALTLDAVYRAVSILETAALQLTIDVWRGGVPLDPAPSLVTRPDVNDTAGSFWAGTVGALALRGNAYWLKQRGADGSVINLAQLTPTEVTPWRDDRGTVRYAYRGRDYTGRDLVHLRLFREPGELLGLGPIQAAARSLRGHLDVAAYGDEWFNRGDTPSGVLSTDQPLTGTQAAEWSAQWASRQHAGGTAVLGSGLKFQHLALKPDEVQWLESQRFGTVAVARLFGIPSRQMLVAIEGGSTTYANAQQEDLAFLKFTLMAYLREIELAVSDLLPRGQSARFNADGLLRTDTLTRYQAHAVAVSSGFLTVDEVRAIEGLPPLTGTPAVTPTAQETPA